VTCPICRRESDPKYRPFCSVRCADVDLGRWLTERYAIPADDAPEEATGDGTAPDDGPGRPPARH
jgi:endogenous inhibitor of DNA gyrase (YacG/DUF329 family)